MRVKRSDLNFEYPSVCWGTNWRVPRVELDYYTGLIHYCGVVQVENGEKWGDLRNLRDFLEEKYIGFYFDLV